MTSKSWNRSEFTFAFLEEPPFATERGGIVGGADVDLARVILALMGVKSVKLRKVEFADLLPGVIAGRWHMNTALFITAERTSKVAFSDPIWALPDGLIVLSGNPHSISTYSLIAGNPDTKLGAVKGTKQIDEAKLEGIPHDRVIEFGSQEDAIEAIRDGRIHAFSATALGNRTFVALPGNGDLGIAEGFRPPTHSGHPSAGFGAFSFAKGDNDLVADFNAAMASYLGTPEHRTMMGRYGFTDAEIDPAIAMRGKLDEITG